MIFNKSLVEGIFPERMKLADVVPLFKSQDRSECTNYRPISLLLTISKLLEKIVYSRTYTDLEKHQKLYVSQYGFREGHSCENAISEVVSQIVKGQQEGVIHPIAYSWTCPRLLTVLNTKSYLRN